MENYYPRLCELHTVYNNLLFHIILYVLYSYPSYLKVARCVNLPVLGHSTLYLCVRAFSTAGNVLTTCQNALLVETDEFDRNTLYDIDASVNTWDKIKEVILSPVE